jgi:carbon-monoxide dehydrogenase medium subunit
MKPAPFTYHDPRTVAEALDALSTLENARVLAGGQSLMPMMNFRFAMPDHVIDINRIAELSYLRIEAGRLRAGAMTRQRDLEFSTTVGERCAILHEALAHVGHRQTRNRGTFGGSLCHLDPSAELVNIATLLDATLHVQSKRGARDITIADFAAGYMTTTLDADELLTDITLVLPPEDAGCAFVEFARRHGDFAIVACSALLTLDRGGKIADAKLAISGLSHAPRRPGEIENALKGESPGAVVFKAAAAQAQAFDAMEDAYVTAEYRKHLARIMTYRALQRAAERAKERAHA